MYACQLHRPLCNVLQVTVIFLVDIDKCLPDQQHWPDVWAQQQAWKQAKKDHEDNVVSYPIMVVVTALGNASSAVLQQLCLSQPLATLHQVRRRNYICFS